MLPSGTRSTAGNPGHAGHCNPRAHVVPGRHRRQGRAIQSHAGSGDRARAIRATPAGATGSRDPADTFFRSSTAPRPRSVALGHGRPPPAASLTHHSVAPDDGRDMVAHLYCTFRAVRDFDQLVRASRLYYELGETQNAIAEQLGVTRPQVSRLLKRARAEGIVEIRIVDRTAADSPAAEALRRSYGLDAVHLAPTIAGPEDLTRRMVGRLAAEVLRGACVPARWSGSAMARPSRRRRPRSRRPPTPVAVTVVPLCGGLLVDRSGARAVPARRGRARRPGARPDGAGPGRRRRHATVARRARRRPRHPRAVGAARCRPLRDRRPGLERGRGRRRDVERELEAADAVGEILVAPFDLDGRFVCPALRERVIALTRARLGRVSRSASASRRARARSGRSSARCGPASCARW